MAADSSPSEATRNELSPVLAGVVDSARWALGALTVGLVLVLASVVMTWWSAYLEYAAAGTFVYTWQALWHGIWRTENAWNKLAAEGSLRWAVPFVLFSVIGGGLLAASDRPGDAGSTQAGPRTANIASGVIVQIASDTAFSRAAQKVESLRATGLPTDILWSSDYRTSEGPLRPNYFVTVVGPYADTPQGRAAANEALARLTGRYPDAFIRHVTRLRER